MKIKCAKCQESANLTPDFATITCEHCGLECTYGEYVKFVAHNDATYSDILADYAGNKSQPMGTLDDWD